MPETTLTPREVAELADVPGRVVEKAIEEKMIAVRLRRATPAGRAMRAVAPHAVAYAAIMARLDLKLPAAHKRRLARALSRLKPSEASTARIEVAPAVEIDVGRLLGDTMERAEAYRAARDAHIEINPDVMGGTPVVRGTRITVHALLGREADGMADILEDYPHLTAEMVEAAWTYARTHPFVGRPGGHPWRKNKPIHAGTLDIRK